MRSTLTESHWRMATWTVSPGGLGILDPSAEHLPAFIASSGDFRLGIRDWTVGICTTPLGLWDSISPVAAQLGVSSLPAMWRQRGSIEFASHEE